MGEITLGSPTDKIVMAVEDFAAEVEREKARQRTRDALVRKAQAGYVTGGRVFGYDNVVVTTADGRRDHVERRINESEATIVRRSFELTAAGYGKRRVAHRLNADRAASPRAQRSPHGWSPTSVQHVLGNPLYRVRSSGIEPRSGTAGDSARPDGRRASVHRMTGCGSTVRTCASSRTRCEPCPRAPASRSDRLRAHARGTRTARRLCQNR
jgi:hypothetical protein